MPARLLRWPRVQRWLHARAIRMKIPSGTGRRSLAPRWCRASKVVRAVWRCSEEITARRSIGTRSPAASAGRTLWWLVNNMTTPMRTVCSRQLLMRCSPCGRAAPSPWRCWSGTSSRLLMHISTTKSPSRSSSTAPSHATGQPRVRGKSSINQ